MKRFSLAVTAAALFFFINSSAQAICLWNCSPTDLSGRDALESYLRASSGGAPFQIESFRRTNGQDVEMMGVKAYLMDVEAVVVFPQGLNVVCLDKNKGGGNYYQRMQTSMNCMNIRNSSGLIVAPGERATLSRRLGFQKTERSWRGDDGRIYK